MRPAAFLDRDGVINIDHGYVYRWEDFAFVPGAVDGMRRLQAAGYALVVVTTSRASHAATTTKPRYSACMSSFASTWKRRA